MARKKVRPHKCDQVVTISDTHFGDRLGLYPCSLEVKLDGAGGYKPNPLQEWLWAQFEDFVDRVVPMWTRGEPFDLVFNGDSLEGVHHDNNPISTVMPDQIEIGRVAMTKLVSMAERTYWLRGTQTHVGPSGEHEESLAKILGAVPNEYGQHARWEMFKRIGPDLVHFTHHVGTTSSFAFAASAPLRELQKALASASKRREEPVRAIVRSHRHQHIGVQPTEAMAIVTPPWQLPTANVYKRGYIEDPHVGGCFLRWHPEVGLYFNRQIYNVVRGRIE